MSTRAIRVGLITIKNHTLETGFWNGRYRNSGLRWYFFLNSVDLINFDNFCRMLNVASGLPQQTGKGRHHKAHLLRSYLQTRGGGVWCQPPVPNWNRFLTRRPGIFWNVKIFILEGFFFVFFSLQDLTF